MESKTVETNNRQVIEKVFEDFYLLIMKDPYMASFIKTHQGISNLVIAQSDYLYNALYSVDSTQVFADYKRLADIHWKIHLDETYLYKMIDYIQDQLIQKIRNQQIDLTARKVESVLNNIKQSTAYSYIFGSIEDTLSTLTPSTELSKIHIDWLIQLSHYLSSQHQWSEDTSTEESGMPITDFSLCRLGKKLSTIQFEITGHSNRSLQIKIEMLHKEIHDIGVLAINYFEKKDFTNALNMIRSLLRNTSILTSLLEQFDYHWKNKKTQILVGYIADKTHQGGLLNISSKSQDEHHQAIYDNIYQQITETIIEQLNNESATFAFTIKKHLYIYIDNKNTKHEVQ
ncbi:MAG: protoglobin domain-containing protein, partial [Pseudomonadota bacterium]|nr:protoglobin domain-containing protein [Pseudomonadota bacterium]